MSAPTTGIYLNSTEPAAPGGNQNVKPQTDGGEPLQSVSFYPQKATSLLLGVVKPDGASIVVDSSGVISATGGLEAPVEIATGTPSTVGLIVQGSEISSPSVTFVQSAQSFGSDTTAFTANVTAGSCIVVAVGNDLGYPAAVPTDTLGNTYVLVKSGLGGSSFGAVYAALNSLPGPCTVTVVFGGGHCSTNLHEYSGVASASAIDSSANASGASLTSLSVGPIATTTGDLVFTSVYGTNQSGGPGTISGFTIRETNTPFYLLETADAFEASAGAYSATWNLSAYSATVSVGAIIIALKAAPAVIQTADLVEFKAPVAAGGSILSGVNGQGQFVMASTSGSPTNLADECATAIDPAAGAFYAKFASGWVNIAGGGGGGGGSVPSAISEGVDWPPSSPTAYDDEFTGSTLNTLRWTQVVNGASNAIRVSNSLLGIVCAANSGDNFTSVSQPVPSGTYEITAKLALTAFIYSFSYSGLCVRDSSGKSVVLNISTSSGLMVAQVSHWNSNTSYGAGMLNLTIISPVMYFRIKDDGTSLIFSLSQDGVNFVQVYTESRTSFLSAPALMGIFCGSNDSSHPCALGCDWFRRTL